jgi:hypothetical protein
MQLSSWLLDVQNIPFVFLPYFMPPERLQPLNIQKVKKPELI